MSNKWAELYDGHHEHNEIQYYSTLGISDIYTSNDSIGDFGLDTTSKEREEERATIISLIVLLSFSSLCLLGVI